MAPLSLASKVEKMKMLGGASLSGGNADELEQAVEAAKPGENIIYAAYVQNLKDRRLASQKALDLASRGMVSLTTIKVQKDPALYHYIAQRSKRKYDRKKGEK